MVKPERPARKRNEERPTKRQLTGREGKEEEEEEVIPPPKSRKVSETKSPIKGE